MSVDRELYNKMVARAKEIKAEDDKIEQRKEKKRQELAEREQAEKNVEETAPDYSNYSPTLQKILNLRDENEKKKISTNTVKPLGETARDKSNGGKRFKGTSSSTEDISESVDKKNEEISAEEKQKAISNAQKTDFINNVRHGSYDYKNGALRELSKTATENTDKGNEADGSQKTSSDSYVPAKSLSTFPSKSITTDVSNFEVRGSNSTSSGENWLDKIDWDLVPDYTEVIKDVDTLAETIKNDREKLFEIPEYAELMEKREKWEKSAVKAASGGHELADSKIEKLDSQISEIPEVQAVEAKEEELAELQNLLTLAYYKLSTSDDFDEKSAFNETALNWKLGEIAKGNESIDENNAYMYQLVNEPEKENPLIRNSDISGAETGTGAELFASAVNNAVFNEPVYIRSMDDDERAIYNYLYATVGSDAANRYLSDMKGNFTSAYRQEMQEKAQKYADEHPIKSSIVSIAETPAKTIAYVGATADKGTEGTIDQNSPRFSSSYTQSAIREEVSENIKEKLGNGMLGNIGSFAYQTGMSMADFVITTAASAGNPHVASAMMSGSAALDTTLSAKDRGLSDKQAFELGVVAGVAEFVTEKFSIETLLDKTGMGKTAVGYLVKNTFAEGSEEVASDFINLFADIMIAKDKSEWNTAIENYKENGYSEKDAFWMAFADQAINMGVDFLGGAVSGMTLASLNVAANQTIGQHYFSHATHSEIANADKTNQTNNLNKINTALNSALSTDTSDVNGYNKAISEFVRQVKNANPDGNAGSDVKNANNNAINLSIDYIREEIRALDKLIKNANDNSLKSDLTVQREALKTLDENIRTNRGEINSALNDSNVDTAVGETVSETLQDKQQPPKIDEYVYMDDFDIYIYDYIYDKLSKGEITQDEADALNADYAETVRTESQKTSSLKELEEKIDKAVNDYRDGKLTKENFKQAYEKYSSELPKIKETQTDTYHVYLDSEGNVRADTTATTNETTDGASPIVQSVTSQQTNASSVNSQNVDTNKSVSQRISDDFGVSRGATVNDVAEHFLQDNDVTFDVVEEQINKYLAEDTPLSRQAAASLGEIESVMAQKNRPNVQKVASAYAPLLKRYGINGITVDSLKSGEYGYYDRTNNTIHISDKISDSGAVGRIILHEFTHRGAQLDMSLANAIVKAMDGSPENKAYISEDVVRKAYADQIANVQNDSEAQSIITEERAAHFMERIMDSPDILREFQDNRSFLRKILDSVQDFFARNNPDKQEQVQLKRIEKTINDILKSSGQVSKGSFAEAQAEIRKSNSNIGNTADGRRFSMELNVDESNDLFAIHNINEDNLLNAFELGGLAMPSIAVTSVEIGHSNFGEISLVFASDTIDPKKAKTNKVYSADAWTATFPTVEYEADSTVANKIKNKYNELYKKYGKEKIEALYPYGNYFEEQLNRDGGVYGIIDKQSDNPEMIQVYLLDTTGKPVETVYSEKSVSMPQEATEQAEFLIDKLGEDTLKQLSARDGETSVGARKRWLSEHGDEFKTAYAEYLVNAGMTADEAKTAIDNMNTFTLVSEARKAKSYLENGGTSTETTADVEATNNAIRNAVNKDDYIAWLHELFDGAEKSKGVSNGKDPYTAQGNRRSFSATHYPVTLDNIVLAMKKQGGTDSKNTNSTFAGAKTIRAESSTEFSSLDDVRSNKELLSQKNADTTEVWDGFDSRLADIIDRIMDTKNDIDNRFIEQDRIGKILAEASHYDTVSGIKKALAKYNLTTAVAEDFKSLVDDIKSAPRQYFEAKPERSVGFDEVKYAIIPENAKTEVKTALDEAGIETKTYESGNEADRLNVLNTLSDVRFSRELAAKSFQKQYEKNVDSVLNGKRKNNNPVIIGATPEIFQEIGFSALPVTITPNHIYSIAKTESEAKAENRYNKSANYHGLGASAVKNIMENISSPLMIIAAPESKSNPQNSSHRVIVLAELKINGNQGIAPIEVDTDVKIDGKNYDANHVVSYYDKNNINNIVGEAIARENIGEIAIYYGNKKRIENFVKGLGFQLPDSFKSISDSDTIIRNIGVNVNKQIENVTQSQHSDSATDNIGTFDRDNPDIRYSRELDDQYMTAVEDGDEFTAQQMVNEAAHNAGYLYRRNTFTTNQPAKGVPWQMFVLADDDSETSPYGESQFAATADGAIQIEDIMDDLRDLSEEYYGEALPDNEINPPDIVDSAGMWDDMDFVQYVWDNYFEDMYYKTDEMPAVITADGLLVMGDDFSRVKNADPISYDENGNVIPLSERFDRTNDNIRYSRQLETAEEKRIRKLEEANDYLKTQFTQKTAFGWAKSVSPAQRNKLASKLASGLPGVTTTETSTAIKSVYDVFERPKRGSLDTADVRFSEAEEAARKAAETLVDSAIDKQVNPLYEQYKDLRNYLRTTTIVAPENATSEFGGKEDYSNWRSGNKGLIRIVNKAPSEGSFLYVDQAYKELSAEYPEFFPANVTNEYDQLRLLSDTATELKQTAGSKNTYENPFDDVRSAVVADLTTEILLGFDETAKTTYAAKQKTAFVEEKRNLKTAYNETIRKLNREINSYNRRINTLENRLTKTNRNAQYYATIKETTARLKRLNNALTNPTYSKHIPQSLKMPIANFLKTTSTTGLPGTNSINFDMVSDIADSSAENYMRAEHDIIQAVDEMAKAIRSSGSNGENAMSDIYLDELSAQIRDVQALYSKAGEAIEAASKRSNAENKPFLDMAYSMRNTTARQLNNIVKMVEKYVSDVNSALNTQKNETLNEFAHGMIQDLSTKKSEKDYGGKNGLGSSVSQAVRNYANNLKYESVSPSMFFEMMGEHGVALDHTFREGQNRQNAHLDEYVTMMKNLTNGKYSTRKASGIDGSRLKVELYGQEVDVSRAQLMSLYCLWNRPAARRHLEAQGAVFLTSDGQQKSNRTYTITQEVFDGLMSKLSDEDKKIAGSMQKFLADECSKWGNEASVALYGYEIYNDPKYFPIEVSESIKTNANVKQFGTPFAQFSLENSGFTKRVNANANSPIVVGDIFNTVEGHVQQMAAYNAYTPACADVNRILKNTELREKIKSTMGNSGYNYLRDFIADVNGNAVSERGSVATYKWYDVLRNMGKRAVIAANFSTAFKQFDSVFRACDEINAKYLVKAHTGFGRQNGKGLYGQIYRKMVENSGVAKMKMLGYSDTGFGQTLRGQWDNDFTNRHKIADSNAVTHAIAKGYDKTIDLSMQMAAKADETVWVALYRACELETADLHGDLTAEQQTKKATERFNEIIGRTQVVDSIMDTTPFSKNVAGKTFGAFMAEPVKTYGHLLVAADALKDGKKGSGKKFAHVLLTTLVASAVIEPLKTAFVSEIRDDEDDGEQFFRKLFANYTGFDFTDNAEETVTLKGFLSSELMDGLVGIVPAFGEIYGAVMDMVNGYSGSDLSTDGVEKTVQYVGKLIGYDTADSTNTKTKLKLTLDTIGSVGTLFGLPFKTLIRDLQIIPKSIMANTDNYKLQWEYQKAFYNLGSTTARKDMQFYNIMANAYKAGDVEAYTYMLEDLKHIKTGKNSIGVSYKAIQEAIEKRGGEYEIGSELWLANVQAEFDLDSYVSGMKVEREIAKVYKTALDGEIGNADDILPSTPTRYSYEKEDKDGNSVEVTMTDTEYAEFIHNVGELEYQILLALGENERYNNLSTEAKVYCHEQVYDLAKRYYRSQFNPDYNLLSWIDDLTNRGINTTKIAREIALRGKDKDKELKKEARTKNK